MKNPDEDVPLSDGEGYMVGKKDFDEYLHLTEKVPEASTSVCTAQSVLAMYLVCRFQIAMNIAL